MSGARLPEAANPTSPRRAGCGDALGERTTLARRSDAAHSRAVKLSREPAVVPPCTRRARRAAGTGVRPLFSGGSGQRCSPAWQRLMSAARYDCGRVAALRLRSSSNLRRDFCCDRARRSVVFGETASHMAIRHAAPPSSALAASSPAAVRPLGWPLQRASHVSRRSQC